MGSSVTCSHVSHGPVGLGLGTCLCVLGARGWHTQVPHCEWEAVTPTSTRVPTMPRGPGRWSATLLHLIPSRHSTARPALCVALEAAGSGEKGWVLATWAPVRRPIRFARGSGLSPFLFTWRLLG